MAKIIVFDEDKNAFEGMTREQINAAIAEATGTTPTNVDDAFISQILEQNKKGNLKFWVGTMAEYNALTEKEEDTLYLFSDDPTIDDIEEAITDVENSLNSYKETNDAEIANIKTTNTAQTSAINRLSISKTRFVTANIKIEWGVDAVTVNTPTDINLLQDKWIATFYFQAESDIQGRTIYISPSVDYNSAQSGVDDAIVMLQIEGLGDGLYLPPFICPIHLTFTNNSISFRAAGLGVGAINYTLWLTSITLVKEA